MVDMKKQEEMMKKDWDNLIVLDACRYDYFKKVYKDYFEEGKLEKVDSEAYETSAWLKNRFLGKYFDKTIYISGTPHVNSVGVNFMKGFDASDHFEKIIDVWDFGWSEDFGGIPPKAVGETTKRVMNKYPEKKIISHFNQPHYPYVGYKPVIKSKETGMIEAKRMKEGEKELIYNKIKKVLRKVLGKKRMKKIVYSPYVKKIIKHISVGGKGKKPIEIFVEKHNKKTLLEAYEKNLRSALEEIKEIVNKSPNKKTIITADHGELLGEEEKYGHGHEDKKLREVPWFEIYP